jgi:hypothetical protein
MFRRWDGGWKAAKIVNPSFFPMQLNGFLPPPVNAGGCSPVPTEITKELSLSICAIWCKRFVISQQHEEFTSLKTAEHRLFCSFPLIMFSRRVYGDEGIAPRIDLGPRCT